VSDRIRAWLRPLRRTPFHPQWFSYRDEPGWLRRWASQCKGLVVDVGCGRQRIRPYLDAGCQYLGTDYFKTATDLYLSRPDLYADARVLPLADGCADTVLLLEVLEHMAEPERALREARRVLRAGGRVIVSVPFIYPVHDAPFDFQRWTPRGLQDALARNGFELVEYRSVGSPSETAALLGCIAVARMSLTLVQRWGPVATIGLVPAAAAVLAINVLGWLFQWVGSGDELMPHACRALGRKTDAAPP
jgi:SAM-dependent methyltransferase